MAEPEIERVNRYDDGRFSQEVLRQHGAFLVNEQPYEVEIMGKDWAQVRGSSPELYTAVIENFRFYAEHICKFYNTQNELVAQFPPVELFPVKLEAIQPSQFYVDEDKLAAVRSFIRGPEDIVIPVISQEGRYISADGHTRLALAVEMGFEEVRGFLYEEFLYEDLACLYDFAEEARKRGVHTPYDLKELTHEEYTVQWDQFCDDFFARRAENDTDA